MNMDSKRVLITAALFLGVGLAAVIFLSLQVTQDSKPIVRPRVEPPKEGAERPKASIYDMDIPFTPTQVSPEVAAEQTEQTKKEKTEPSLAKEKIKSTEQESVEKEPVLSQETDSGTPVTSQGSSSTGAASDSTASDSQTTKGDDLNPTEKDIRNVQKRGLVIF